MTATLFGDMIISIGTALVADKIGRRWMLAVGSLLMALSGAAFATCNNFWILLIASILGVISPSGGDVGPFKSIEESTISHLMPFDDLNATLAWYYTLGTFGASAGLSGTGWLLQILQDRGMLVVDTYRTIFWIYTALGAFKTFLTAFLSKGCEVSERRQGSTTGDTTLSSTETEPLLESAKRNIAPPLSTAAQTRQFLMRFCPILILDNVGTGLSMDSWLTYFVSRTFPSVSNGMLGSVFSVCAIIVSFSNILAIPVVSQIGILSTMIFGHVLASLFLMGLPLAWNFKSAVGFLVARAVFLDFDQATRQSFIAQSIPPPNRTAALGIINVIRTLAQSIGPSLTGILAQREDLGFSFVLAGVVKLAYDVLLAVVFLSGN
ncbi:hypothetical protein CBER1_09248 [Cercospora berteroae]|uniref:Major facilitator superfamily (MFS) profile domain-containing protein n=1 Tax=Cercospora berteroae TaxID=357750 RepID=A0A2S6BXV7_9PEZI|nr:hypothetical protein CBER1_09248 [Cercospora berteroae]